CLVRLVRVLLGQRPFFHTRSCSATSPVLCRCSTPAAVHGRVIAHRFLHSIRHLSAADSRGSLGSRAWSRDRYGAVQRPPVVYREQPYFILRGVRSPDTVSAI